MKRIPQPMTRALLTSVLFALTAGCDSTAGCDGVMSDLAQPLPQARLFDDAATIRVSNNGLTFIQDQLPNILSDLGSTSCDEAYCADDWATCDANNICKTNTPDTAFIAVKIPPTVIPNPGGGLKELAICLDGQGANTTDCTVYVELDNIDLGTNSNNTVDFGADLQIFTYTDGLKTRIDPASFLPYIYCDLSLLDATTATPTAVNKHVSATMTFNNANPLGRLSMDIQNFDATVTQDDVLLCGIADWDVIKGLLFNFLADQINAQLETAVTGLIKGMLNESCLDTPCSRPDVSSCVADVCQFSDGSPVPTLLGLEGTLNTEALLGGFAGQASGIDVAAFASTATTKDGGLSLGLTAGASAPHASCVPQIDRPAGSIPVFSPGSVTPRGDAYHVAIGASDRLLNTILYQVFDGGALCQSMSGDDIGALTSGALSLLTPSLADLTGGSVPLVVDILPRAQPRVEIGRNVVSSDPNNPGRFILDEPLLNIVLDDVDIDVYARVGDGDERVLTLNADLLIDMSLAVDGTGELKLVVGDSGSWIRRVDILNSDVLRESPTDIADAIPTLLGIVLPLITNTLDQSFVIPSVAGFEVSIGDISGISSSGTTVDGDTKYAHMGLFGTLAYNAPVAQQAARIQTTATLTQLDVPPAAAIRDGGKVRVTIAVGGRGLGDQVPMVWHRVDGGPWRPVAQTRELVVIDPLLLIEGAHVIEVAAARPGAPLSLDQSPEEVHFVVDAQAPGVQLRAANGQVHVSVYDSVSGPADLTVGAWVDGAFVGPVLLDGHGDGIVAVDSSQHVVRIAAQDGAERVGEAVIGTPTVSAGQAQQETLARAAPRVDDNVKPSVVSRGCRSTGADVNWPVLLGVLLLIKGRRQRR